MNRRSFLVRSLSAAAICTLPINVIGCNSNDTEQDINAIIAACQSVVAVAEPGATWLPEMNAAITALEGAEKAWTGGSPISVVESALNTVAAVTAVIPLTAAYSPLIDVIVAAIDTVLALTAPAASSNAVSSRAVTQNPHAGRVKLLAPHMLQKRHSAFIQQFNDTAVGIGLPQAKIK